MEVVDFAGARQGALKPVIIGCLAFFRYFGASILGHPMWQDVQTQPKTDCNLLAFQKSGGAIYGLAKVNVSDSSFINNSAGVCV